MSNLFFGFNLYYWHLIILSRIGIIGTSFAFRIRSEHSRENITYISISQVIANSDRTILKYVIFSQLYFRDEQLVLVSFTGLVGALSRVLKHIFRASNELATT